MKSATLTFRRYISSDLSAPASSPYTLDIKSGSRTPTAVQVTAGYMNVLKTARPVNVTTSPSIRAYVTNLRQICLILINTVQSRLKGGRVHPQLDCFGIVNEIRRDTGLPEWPDFAGVTKEGGGLDREAKADAYAETL